MSTYQTPLDQLKFITGQDNLTDTDGLRLLNYALDAYSSIVMECDGRWKWDDSRNTDHPKGYAALVAGQSDYQLDITFLQIDQVHVKIDGRWKVLTQADSRENRDEPLDQQYATSGDPQFYDFDGESIFLYPAPDFTDTGDLTDTDNLSLRVLYTRPATAITALSDTLGIPTIHAEYLALHAARQLAFRVADSARSDIRDELVKWEGQEINGQRSGGKIRSFFEKRDEDRPRRMKPKSEAAFTRTFNRT